MKLTRRDLGKLAMAAIPGAESSAAPRPRGRKRAAKPNSKFAGVQIGLNVPYNFGGRDMNPDELLDRILKLNVNAVEMRSQPVENFLGSPAANGQKAEADVMRKWRASVSMDRVAAFRKKYEDAGVLIEIVKYDGIYTMADAEVDYCFNARAHAGRARASRARSTPSTPSASVSSPTSTSCRSPITATRRRRLSIGRRRSSRRATTGRISISATSSPATTRRRCPSSSSTTRASRTCT